MDEILYIDDEIHNLNTFKTAFRHLYTIHTAKSAFEGLDILKDNDIKLVISDQRGWNVRGRVGLVLETVYIKKVIMEVLNIFHPTQIQR